MTKKLWIAVVASSAALMLTGCLGNAPDVDPSGKASGNQENPGGGITTDGEGGILNNNPTGPEVPVPVDNGLSCAKGSAYTGFSGTDLIADRNDQLSGLDRARVKPYSSLSAEYNRVLGNTPALVTTTGSTFGEPAARWSTEPQAGAVSLYTAYRVAFQGCLTYTGTAANYANAPTDATARTECAAIATKFWSRDASSAELDTCVKATVADTTTEANARRRWAYGCASVLSAAAFLSY